MVTTEQKEYWIMASDGIDPNDVRFFSGSSHPQLAANITQYLNVPLDNTEITRFSNDNLYIQLGASVRSRKVFIVQSLSQPVNDHLMELLIMIDIARSAGAAEVHAIIPYFSFSRSDKKDAPRISITARLIADLLQTAGATHIMTRMLQSSCIQAFFPTTHSRECDCGSTGYGARKIRGALRQGSGLARHCREQGAFIRYESDYR
jgi:ribose-phosphate pyrophosphokinase